MSQRMKRLLPFAMLLMTGALVAPAANADLVHTLSTSTQLTVDSALTVGTRLGSTYAVSGNNIKVADSGHFGTMTAATATAASGQDIGAYDINTAGSAFSFSESWVQGDAINPIGTGVDVTAGVVADMPAYGQVQTNSGGVAGTLAGTITSAGVVTLTAGGAGTTATGQFVSEITVR
jgi:hypothetical protein